MRAHDTCIIRLNPARRLDAPARFRLMIDRSFPERLRVPVCAAPMFLVSGPELVIAACRAGVMGAFPAPNPRTLDEFDAWLAQISAAVGDAPWAVNLITHASNDRLAGEI